MSENNYSPSDSQTTVAARSSLARMREHFNLLAELDADARAAWLTANIANAEERAALERLLELDSSDGGFLDTPVGEHVSHLRSDEPHRPESLIGQRIGAFRLTRLLGKGGMAAVFLGERADGDFQQLVAVKLLRRGLYSEYEQRLFRRERQLLASLDHPNIAHLIDGGITDAGIPYLVIEYVDGASIIHHATERRLGVRQRLDLMLVVCHAVEAAHRALIVHRDIKPANVLVTHDGTVKLLDFGIARLLEDEPETFTFGVFTPDYAAPEQIAGESITTATDVYGLGLLLHELLLGQRPGSPLRKPSAMAAAMSDTRFTTPTLLARTLRGDLDTILMKALATEPEMRYSSAGALANDIERHLTGQPVTAHPPSPWYRTRKFVQRHRGGVMITAALVVAIFAALGLALWEAKAARDAAQAAEREAGRANATKKFLIQVFQASDPSIAQDKPRGQITAKELLDLNAPSIAEKFANDPDTQIELLGVTASIYNELDDQKNYRLLRDQQVALVRKHYGELHPILVDALMDDAQKASDGGDYAGAQQLLDQADALIHRAGNDRTEQRARWWLFRAAALADDSSRAEATKALRNADELYTAVAPNDSGHVTALHLLGENFISSDPAQAEQYYRRALGVSDQASERNDGELFFIYRGLAQVREYQGDFDGAETAFEHAVEVAHRTFGEADVNYWTTMSEFGQMLSRAGKRERSHAIFDQLFKALPQDAKDTVSDDSVRVSHSAYAREAYAASLTAEGRARDAVPLLENVQRTYLAYPGNEGNLRRMRRYLGDAYDLVGRADDARIALKAALDGRIAKDPPDYPPLLTIRERWGRFLLTQNDAAGAEEQFRAVLAQAHDRKIEPVALAQGGMARLAIAGKDATAATSASRNAIELFDHTTGLHDVRSGPYLWLIHAEALRLSGDTAGAHEWAQRALAASQRYDDPSAASIVAARSALAATIKP